MGGHGSMRLEEWIDRLDGRRTTFPTISLVKWEGADFQNFTI